MADLERLEEPWLSIVPSGKAKPVATLTRLLLAHLTVQRDRLNQAMVLDCLEGNSQCVHS